MVVKGKRLFLEENVLVDAEDAKGNSLGVDLWKKMPEDLVAHVNLTMCKSLFAQSAYSDFHNLF